MHPTAIILILCSAVLQTLFPQQQDPAQERSETSGGDHFPPLNGLTISAVGKSEFWQVQKGGLNSEPHLLSNADLTMTADLSEFAGITGTELMIHALANNGECLSGSVGDAQMVSNIEAYRTVKLYQLLIRHSIPSLGLSLLAGVYDLNSEFYVTPSSGIFLNGSHGIGIELGQTGLNGPSIFPNTALSVRLQYSPAEQFQFSAAVIDGHPGSADDCTAFDLTVNSSDGFFTIGEAALLQDASSKYAVGFWYFTGTYADVCAVDGLEEYTERRDNAGFYILADKKVFSESGSETEGLSFFSRFGMTNHHINEIQFHFGGGFTYTGPFEGRSEDQIGYAVAFASYGSDFQKLNRFLSNPVASNETVHELTYRSQFTQWLAGQFDLQYIVHPSASLQIQDPIVAGFRAELSL